MEFIIIRTPHSWMLIAQFQALCAHSLALNSRHWARHEGGDDHDDDGDADGNDDDDDDGDDHDDDDMMTPKTNSDHPTCLFKTCLT